jgi:hypothetical protein
MFITIVFMSTRVANPPKSHGISLREILRELRLSLIALKEPGVIGLKEPLGSGNFGDSERATD